MTMRIFLAMIGMAAAMLSAGAADEALPAPSLEVRAARAPTPGTLAAAAADGGRYAGVSVRASSLQSARYANAVAAHFTVITPENALKLGLNAQGAGFDYAEMDAVATFAREHGLGVRLHTLVWEHDDGIPAAFADLSPAACRARFDAHARQTVARYADVLVAVDVVNEPLNAQGRVAMERWARCLGPNPIGVALHATREALNLAGRADVPLVINEFDVLSAGPKLDGLVRLIGGLRAAGTPVDAIGVQAHLRGDRPLRLADAKAAMQRLADTGLKVEVTELDVVGTTGSAAAAQVGVVGAACASIGEVCMGVTAWGVSDGTSWLVQDVPGSREEPTLLDTHFRPKAGYDALRDTLSGG